MTDVAALLSEGRARLADASPSAGLDAEVLLAAALGKDRTWLFTWPEHQPDDSQMRIYRDWLQRRVQGEPVAYLVGRREFFGYAFLVSEATLIPRPDTELLVESILDVIPAEAPCRVLDLGTGTGAIAIALALSRPAWQVEATDLFREALYLAERNKLRLQAGNVALRQSRWYAQVQGRFDVIVSNPPYIRENDQHLQQGDLRFEPRSALTAGEDGLDDLREIIAGAAAHLTADGLLALEHGYDQGQAVRELMQAAAFGKVETRLDLGGHERVTLGWVAPADA